MFEVDWDWFYGEDKKDEKTMATQNGARQAQIKYGVVPTWCDEPYEEFLFLFDNYIELNDVAEEKKTRLFFASLGQRALKVKKLTGKKEVKDITLLEARKCAAKLFAPTVNKYAARDVLQNRKQHEGESVADYSTALQTCAEACEYAASEEDAALVARFLAGLQDQEMKLQLYGAAEGKTFSQLVEKAILIEQLQRSISGKSTTSNADVNQVGGQSRGHPSGYKKGYKKRKKQDSQQKNKASDQLECFGCGKRGHKKAQCRSCWRCKKFGHKSNDCKQTNWVNDEIGDEGEVSSDNLVINQVKGTVLREKEYKSLYFPGYDTSIEFECDTGSVHSVMGESWMTAHGIRGYKLSEPPKGLRSASGHSLKVLGVFQATVLVRNKKQVIEIVVVKDNVNALLGTRAMDKLYPTWREAFSSNQINGSGGVANLRKYMKQLSEAKGAIRKVEVKLQLKKADPVLARPYKLPPGLAMRVKEELERLVKEDILYPVEETEWASPMVVVPKKNGKVRLCIDPSKTINPHLITDHYPLPRVEEVLMNFSGKRIFSLIDMNGAYLQLKIHPESQPLLTVNTPFGLYRYKRMPFGIMPAPAIFQKVVERILQGLACIVFLDDILIAAGTKEEMKEILCQVLERLLKYEVQINIDKTTIFAEKITYLGHVISSQGIEPCEDKIRAMKEAPAPSNIKELQSFIGFVGYYQKFMPRLQEKLYPMFKLLKKSKQDNPNVEQTGIKKSKARAPKWDWGPEQDKAFEDIQELITRCQILTHYDPKKELVLATDASDKGICGVLCQIEGGVEKPVLFFSRVLSETEKNYPILHREALAIVYALERCYHYIFGKRVTVFTDHRPLVGLLGTHKGLPPVVATRLQRYMVRLSIFEYVLKYRKGVHNLLADFGSRHPSRESPSPKDKEEEERAKVNVIIGNKGIDLTCIAKDTLSDEILKDLKKYLEKGWPNDIPRNMKQWYKQREKLDLARGCVMFEGRVWIPDTLKREMLGMLHHGHVGMTRMKILGQRYVYWPKMAKDIEHYVKSCECCAAASKKRAQDVFSSWNTCTEPMERVHIDFFHFGGKTFLIFVDAYSRWPEVKDMTQTTASAVSKTLVSIFDILGDPLTLVSDNGPPFNSEEFGQFLRKRGIKYIHSPPWHPQSNGLAERNVRTIKGFLKKALINCQNEGTDFNLIKNVNKFLKCYRNTPNTVDGLTPAEKLFAYSPRNELNKLVALKAPPTRADSIPKDFEENEIAWYREELDPIYKRTKCIVKKRISNVVYLVKVGNRDKKAHINQLSKYTFRHKLFDTIEIEAGSKPGPELRRSKRVRSIPKRFNPSDY